MDNRKLTSIFEILGSVLSHDLCLVDSKQYWQRKSRLRLAIYLSQPVRRLGHHRPPMDVFTASSLLRRLRHRWLDPLGVISKSFAQAKGDLFQPRR